MRLFPLFPFLFTANVSSVIGSTHMTPNLRDCSMTEQKKPPNKRVVAFKQCQDDQDLPHLNLFHFLPI